MCVRLVGSEMCIRDRTKSIASVLRFSSPSRMALPTLDEPWHVPSFCAPGAVSYTHLTLPTNRDVCPSRGLGDVYKRQDQINRICSSFFFSVKNGAAHT